MQKQTYKVERRFFHQGDMQKPGEEVELNELEAARLHVYISGPLKKPRRSRRRAKSTK